MKKVITYGTFDLLHYGHIRLLERAKQLGDYLVVGVTSEDFDKKRGKINVQQTTIERVKAVRDTGLADEIIIEEYEGQKIDDIINYGIDIFAIGSDWEGKFDYLNEYCKVIYLPRTEGVSSSDIRTKKRKIKMGIIGNSPFIMKKIIKESEFINGLDISGVCLECDLEDKEFKNVKFMTDDYDKLLKESDSIYVISHPRKHYEHIKKALIAKKHVIYESPLSLNEEESVELFELANKNNCILMEGIKTAYSIAFQRLILLVKGGAIGKIISVESTCTSLKKIDENDGEKLNEMWNSIYDWGPTAMLPIFQLLGTDYKEKRIISKLAKGNKKFDLFTKIDFLYDNAVASIKVGKGAKSEGELIITGTKGYIYVPAPWWKTDYFEVRYEDVRDTKRYFYKLDGEGIRNELLTFTKSINENKSKAKIIKKVCLKISKIFEDFNNKIDLFEI